MGGRAGPVIPYEPFPPPVPVGRGALAGMVGPALAAVLGFLVALVIVAYPALGLPLALSFGGLLVLVRRPEVLLACFAVALGIPVQKSLAGLPVNAADAVVVLWCGLWPLMMLAPGRREGWRPPLVALAIGPFLLAVLIAQFGAVHGAGGVKQALRIVEWFIVLPVLLTVFRPEPGFWRFLIPLMLVVPCLFAIDGMVEMATSGRSLSGMIGIPVPAPADTEDTIHHTFEYAGRAGSTFGGAQGLAMFVVMLMGVAAACILRPPSPGLRWGGLIALAICIGGLAVAQSRGGILGGITALAVVGLLARPRIGLGAIVLGGICAVTGVVLFLLAADWDGTLVGLVPGRPEAVADRLIIWRMALEIWVDHPLFGVGLGGFRDEALARGLNPTVTLGYESTHAHNTFLEILTGAGLAGLLAYLGFLAVVIGRLLRRWRMRGPAATDPGSTLTLAALGSAAAYLVFANVDMLLLQNMHMVLVLMLCLGLMPPSARGAEGPP